MCGISGIYSKKKNIKKILHDFNHCLRHRGPDAKNIFFDNNYFGMAHTRLSILDISNKGSQPMIYKNKWIISYNGEIYNHLQIRKYLNELLNFSIMWDGNSDTETILKCIDILGIKKSLNLFEGMFAFALYDKINKQLYLARDRIGEKPLYFYFKNDELIFGSEISIFKCIKDFNLQIDTTSISNFIQTGYIAAPNSIFKDVKKIKPGTYIVLSNNFNNFFEENYWSLKDTTKKINNEKISYIEIRKKTKKLLEDKIKQTMISDVQIGSFLSGGIDSSLVTSIMNKFSSTKIKTFTVGFDDKNFDESVQANKVSSYLGTEHFNYRASNKDILNLVSNIHNVYQEPFADSSQLPTYLIAKLMHKEAKVILSGDGGDELFAGYKRYIFFNKINKIANFIPNNIKKHIYRLYQSQSFEFLNNYLFNRNFGDKFSKLLNYITASNEQELYKKFVSVWEDCSNICNLKNKNLNFKYLENNNLISFEEKMMYNDQLTYLPDDILCKVDRATMANSIESRAPFLNHKIIESSWNIPIKHKLNRGIGKFILKDILHDYLPQNLIQKQKIGFSISIGHLLRTDLKNWGEEIISQSKNYDNFINIFYLKKIWKNHQERKINIGERLWVILNLQNWLINSNFK